MLIITIQEFNEPPYGLVPAGTRMNLSDKLAADKILSGLAVPEAEQQRTAVKPELELAEEAEQQLSEQ